MEAWNETGSEKEVAVLSMPEHTDWILYFPDPDNNKDPSLLFNTFIYELGKQCGRYAPRFRWVELFVNDGCCDWPPSVPCAPVTVES